MTTAVRARQCPRYTCSGFDINRSLNCCCRALCGMRIASVAQMRVVAGLLSMLLVVAAPLHCSSRLLSSSQDSAAARVLHQASADLVPSRGCTFPSGQGRITVNCNSGYSASCCNTRGSSGSCYAYTGYNPDCGNTGPSYTPSLYSYIACCPA